MQRKCVYECKFKLNSCFLLFTVAVVKECILHHEGSYVHSYHLVSIHVGCISSATIKSC